MDVEVCEGCSQSVNGCRVSFVVAYMSRRHDNALMCGALSCRPLVQPRRQRNRKLYNSRPLSRCKTLSYSIT